MSESKTTKKQNPWLFRDADYVRQMIIVYPMGDETKEHNERLEHIARRLEELDDR